MKSMLPKSASDLPDIADILRYDYFHGIYGLITALTFPPEQTSTGALCIAYRGTCRDIT